MTLESPFNQETVEQIAKAMAAATEGLVEARVLAERERCARIAEACNDPLYGIAIAAAIRSGK